MEAELSFWSPFTPVAALDLPIAPTTAVYPETATAQPYWSIASVLVGFRYACWAGGIRALICAQSAALTRQAGLPPAGLRGTDRDVACRPQSQCNQHEYGHDPDGGGYWFHDILLGGLRLEILAPGKIFTSFRGICLFPARYHERKNAQGGLRLRRVTNCGQRCFPMIRIPPLFPESHCNNLIKEKQDVFPY